MKTPLLLLSFAALALGFQGTAARADFTPDFGASPYGMDQTIIGADGWEPRLPTPTPNLDSARVIAVRWNQYKPAVMLRGANLKNVSFHPATGDKVEIRFSLAANFPEQGGLGGRQLRIWFGDAALGEIYFNQNPGDDGGLGYHGDGGGRTGGTICVPKAEVKINSYYDFTIKADMGKQTFSISVTGEKKDGTPLAYKADDVPFLPGKNPPHPQINSITIMSGPRTAIYLGSLAIESK